MLEQQPDLEALVLSVGGGSHAVGALLVARAMKPGLKIYGVQATVAPSPMPFGPTCGARTTCVRVPGQSAWPAWAP